MRRRLRGRWRRRRRAALRVAGRKPPLRYSRILMDRHPYYSPIDWAFVVLGIGIVLGLLYWLITGNVLSPK